MMHMSAAQPYLMRHNLIDFSLCKVCGAHANDSSLISPCLIKRREMNGNLTHTHEYGVSRLRRSRVIECRFNEAIF